MSLTLGGPVICPVLFPVGLTTMAVLYSTHDSDVGPVPAPGPIPAAPVIDCKTVESPAGPSEMCLVPAGQVPVCDRDNNCPPVSAGPVLFDRNEVTVEQFAACVKAGACLARKFHTVERSEFCNYGVEGRENHPMNCVEWSGAKQFCTFAGKRLPTREEWILAAGGADGRKYPWGDAPPDCSLAQFHSDKGRGCGNLYTVPAGSLPAGASPFGINDLAGNVMEWTSTLAQAPLEPKTEAELEAEDETMRVTAGGSFADTTEVLVLGFFSLDEQESMHVGMGVRCARDPQ